jgi:hypothetical protein
MRMATLMSLHREESYHLQNPSPEMVVNAESARRTLVSPLLNPYNPHLETNRYCSGCYTVCALGLKHHSQA